MDLSQAWAYLNKASDGVLLTIAMGAVTFAWALWKRWIAFGSEVTEYRTRVAKLEQDLEECQSLLLDTEGQTERVVRRLKQSGTRP